ncbi:MAG: twin-arginine translocase subunit TatC [Legionella sp.]|nr:MAG: twin-arginine translocase subunit TatC [Legionella sp.]
MTNSIKFLIELRKRLLNTFGVFGVLFAAFFCFSTPLFYWYMLPLQRVLPKSTHLIATQIATPLLTPLCMATNLALLCTIPYGLFHLWRFASPALYRSEQKKIQFVLGLSIGLFVLGNLFCYFLILPFMFQCIIHALPKDVLFLPDMGSAASFITWMMIIFGLSFQIPLLCMVLIQIQMIQISHLIAARPYIIVAAFTLGMLLTPPDVLSQILLAVPLWGLYESGICLSRILIKPSSS